MVTVYVLPVDHAEPVLWVWVCGALDRAGWDRARDLAAARWGHRYVDDDPVPSPAATTVLHQLVAAGWAQRVVYSVGGREVDRPPVGLPRYSALDLLWFALLRPLMWRLDPERAHELTMWAMDRLWLTWPLLVLARVRP